MGRASTDAPYDIGGVDHNFCRDIAVPLHNGTTRLASALLGLGRQGNRTLRPARPDQARMLVNMALKLRALRRMDLRIVAAAAIALIGAVSAKAGGVMTNDCLYDHSGGYGHGAGSWSCVRTWHDGQTNPYVIRVPQPQSDGETTQAAERERLWKARCHPVIRQDQYGVPRYHYAAPGCDLGKYE
jgi:hypothetical protein